MTMSPRATRLALTAHVTSSVGWLGAVACFLGLAIIGLTHQDAPTVRAVYLVIEPAGWFVLVPFSFASLITGLIQSLGTKWGLFRHYWVFFKLLMNVGATVVLLMYMQTLRAFALMAAAEPAITDVHGLRRASPVLHSGAALLLLLVATILAIYKPQGLTPYGWRKQHALRAGPEA